MADQQVLLSAKAADLQQGQPNYNHDSHWDIAVRWHATIANYHYRALIEFDLAQLVPQQASQITQARLRVSFAGALNYHSDAVLSICCHRVTAAWLESEVTWNSRQAGTPWSSPGADFGASPIDTISSPDNPSGWGTDWYDITQLLKDWFDGTHPNYGLLLKLETESGLQWVQYQSDDSTEPEQYRPALVVDYEQAAPAADDISPIATLIRRRRR